MQEYILAAPEADGAGNPLLNIAVFAIFIIVTLYVVTRAGKTTSESADFYTVVPPSAVPRTAWPSRATTSPPHPSWALWAPSR